MFPRELDAQDPGRAGQGGTAALRRGRVGWRHPAQVLPELCVPLVQEREEFQVGETVMDGVLGSMDSWTDHDLVAKQCRTPVYKEIF